MPDPIAQTKKGAVPVRAAVIIAPYHTNGGYPPLGAAYLNAVLRAEGIEVEVFDLQFALAIDEPELLLELKRNHNIGRNLQFVQAILDIRFVLYCLYEDTYPDFPWQLSNDLIRDIPLDPGERDERAKAYRQLAVRLRSCADRYAATIAEAKPSLALLSTYIPNVLFSLLLAQRLRRLVPAISILIGGPGTSLPDTRRFILDARLADAIALRDGEPILREIASRFHVAGCLDLDVPGVVTAASDPCTTAPPLPDLDALPVADFTGFPMPHASLADYQRNWKNEYRSKCFDSFMLPVQTSRGCCMRCAFCSESVFWTRFNARSPSSIVEELRIQKRRYGARCFSFNASLINHDDAWHQSLLEELCAADLDISWWGYCRPTSDLSAKTAALMRRAGCAMVSVGVESFSQTALNGMNKGTQSEDALQSIIALIEAGIFVDFALLTGFPGKGHDLQAEYDDNIRHLRRLKDHFGSGRRFDISAGVVLRVEPYSPLCSDPDRFGITKSQDSIELPEPLSALSPSVSRLSSLWNGEASHDDKQIYARRLSLFVQRVFG
jgi:hypothetical protein